MAVKSSIIHLYLYGVLKSEIGKGNFITTKDIVRLIKWRIRIPRKYYKDILQEMCDLNLIKKINRDNYEVIPIKLKPLTDCSGDALW